MSGSWDEIVECAVRRWVWLAEAGRGGGTQKGASFSPVPSFPQVLGAVM